MLRKHLEARLAMQWRNKYHSCVAIRKVVDAQYELTCIVTTGLVLQDTDNVGSGNETSTSRVFFSLDAETLCSVCSACKKSGFWQVTCKVKRRNDVVAGEAVVCFLCHKRVILDNRTQIRCVAKQWFNSFPVETPLSLWKCFFLSTNIRSKYFADIFQRPRIEITERSGTCTPQVQMFTVKAV